MGSQTETLPVRNRGFIRFGVLGAPDGPSREELERSEPRAFLVSARMQEPWRKLKWWESEYQTAEGLRAIISHPFLVLPENWQVTDAPKIQVPLAVCYDYALRLSEEKRILVAANFIAAMARQAREFYSAVESSGVSELSRPVLFFYGALALAKAATAAVFGVDKLEQKSHGLGHAPGPSARTSTPPWPTWPTVIKWRDKGVFPMLYRATMWDADLYRASSKEARWQKQDQPQFHILECIRWLNCDWGRLPPTGFEPKLPHVGQRSNREKCLLTYSEQGDIFLNRETPWDRTVFQVPTIAVQYMLLYYYSILARYHGLEWQELIGPSKDPEGYVFRIALEDVAYKYLLTISRLLPLPQERPALPDCETATEPPSIDVWYKAPNYYLLG